MLFLSSRSSNSEREGQMAYSSEPDGASMPRPRGVHLVGSVPLQDNAAVFREVSSKLGNHLRRIPDGETGTRKNWIFWQFPLLTAVPQFEVSSSSEGGIYQAGAPPRLQLRAGASTGDVELPSLGYRDAALDSYLLFSELKNRGEIDVRVRFQVSLPTPLAVIHGRFIPRDQGAVEELYERKLLEELDGIVAAVPAGELAVQWDTAVEFSLLEGILDSYFPDKEAGVLERLLRLGSHVPEEVQLGYHLCYGDLGHKHFKEPENTSKLVMIANGVAEGLQRPLNWIHMPVPRNRTDEAYFAPLRDLQLQSETEFYLGLVHLTDGLEGTRARIVAAQAVIRNFGVATECGLGRRDPETIPELLAIHAQVADPV
jgi:hypothetical protein